MLQKTIQLGRQLTKKEMKIVKGGDSCTYSYQDGSGTWHTETGGCSTYWNGSTSVGFCYTQSHQSPTPLTSNRGLSRCPAY